MSKKLIIMIAAAGLVSFGGVFIFGWLTKTPPQSEAAPVEQEELARVEAEPELPWPETSTVGDSEMKRAMAKKRLESLVQEVRAKMQKYDDKLQSLEAQEQRLQIAHGMIKKDIEELNDLRIKLASVVVSLKEQQDKLLKTRLNIAKTEKTNLRLIAAAYDKMDPDSAGKILTNMSRMQDSGASSFDDAVKILHYMTGRSKAKLLAGLVTSEPKLAALLCQRLKQITIGE